jgi:hypothetical protein
MERNDRLRRKRGFPSPRRRRDAQTSNSANPGADRSPDTAARHSSDQSADTRKTNRISNRIRRLINALMPPEIRSHRISLAAESHAGHLQLQLALAA